MPNKPEYQIRRVDKYGQVSVFLWSESEWSGQITVHKDKEIGSRELQPATINWPACGEKTKEYTKDFLEALRQATLLAVFLDNAPLKKLRSTPEEYKKILQEKLDFSCKQRI